MIPTVDDRFKGITIVGLQAKLDNAKSAIGAAHNLYDKDPVKLAALQDTYATSDRLQATATQLMTLIGQNDHSIENATDEFGDTQSESRPSGAKRMG